MRGKRNGYSWILDTAIIGLFLAVLWMPGGSLVLKSSGFLLEGYELLCRMFLRLPNAVVVTGKPEIWKIVIYYCLLFAFVMWWRRKIIEKKMEEKKGKWKKEVQNRAGRWDFSSDRCGIDLYDRWRKYRYQTGGKISD